jgi:hypothetical protein
MNSQRELILKKMPVWRLFLAADQFVHSMRLATPEEQKIVLDMLLQVYPPDSTNLVLAGILAEVTALMPIRSDAGELK